MTADRLEHLLGLLAEARLALPPEHFYLAGRIQDAINPVQGEPIVGSLPADPSADLVFENYGDGFGYFRR